MTVEVRQASPEDVAEVVAFTRETWPDRRDDYLPRVFADWVATDGETQRTFVADRDGTAVGLVQAVLLSAHEAWFQGMRVAPAARGRGISTRLHETSAAWARERGATVGRCMVFSWNEPALAASRAAGFDAGTEFRWVHPPPDADAAADLDIGSDPEAGWTYWRRSPARDHLRGLALAMDRSWALCELTPATLRHAAAETHLAVVGDRRPRGVAFRSHDHVRNDGDGGTERRTEYGVAAWDDVVACRALLAGVSRDAAALGADRTRVLVPETVGAVSDAAVCGAAVADEPTFVLEADLTGD